MIITSKVNMDLQRPGIKPVVDVVQDDKYSRNLEIRLCSGRKPFPIPGEAAALIRYRKFDRKGGEYDTLPDGTKAWSVKGNILTVALAPQALTTPGSVDLSVSLIVGEEQLSTFQIRLNVQPVAHASIAESENYFYVTGFLPAPESGTVGQYLCISAIDENGRITGVEAANAPAGSSVDETTVLRYSVQELTDDQKAQARENIGVSDVVGQAVDQLSNVVDLIGVNFFSGKTVEITTPNGYNSWPFIESVNGKLVCVYTNGLGHYDTANRSILAKTSKNGVVWTPAKQIIDTVGSEDTPMGKGRDNDGNMLFWVRGNDGSGYCYDLYKTSDGNVFTKVASPTFPVTPAHIGDAINVDVLAPTAYNTATSRFGHIDGSGGTPNNGNKNVCFDNAVFGMKGSTITVDSPDYKFQVGLYRTPHEGEGYPGMGNFIGRITWMNYGTVYTLEEDCYVKAEISDLNETVQTDTSIFEHLDYKLIADKGISAKRIMAFYNTSSGWGVLYSEDNGATWTQQEVESGLDRPESPAEISAVYLGDGKILAMGRKDADSTNGNPDAMFQMQSEDCGATWTKQYTNITDIALSTPSILYTAETNTLNLYYFQRGVGALRLRIDTVDNVWDNPTNWSESSVIANGTTDFEQTGNVNAVAFDGNQFAAFYSGEGADTGIYVTIV